MRIGTQVKVPRVGNNQLFEFLPSITHVYLSTLYTSRVGESGGHVTHHNFFTILAVDEALAHPTSPRPMTMFDAIHEDEGDSKVTTQTLANHEHEAHSTEEEHIHAGESIASPHPTPACSRLPIPLW